jgi:hypothetical protein
MVPTKELHQILFANLGKTETLAMIIQAYGEESMNGTRKVQIYQDQKARQVKSKVNSMIIIFFNIKGIVHKVFIVAGQTVNSEHYGDFSW